MVKDNMDNDNLVFQYTDSSNEVSTKIKNHFTN